MRRYSGILWGILLIGVLMTVTNPRIKHVDPGKYLDYAEYYLATGHTVDYALVRSATYVIAASDATNAEKQGADVVCDGVQDDVEIQAAITAIGSRGVVKLSSGAFYLSAACDLASLYDVSIEGSGTQLYLAASANCAMFTGGGGRIKFSDLYAHGNSDNNTSGSFYDGAVTLSTFSRIKATYFAGNGLVLDGWGNRVVDCGISYCGGYGIHCTSTSFDNYFMMVNSECNDGAGMYLEGTAGGERIANCHFGESLYGIHALDISTCYIEHCWFHKNDRHGLYLEGTSSCGQSAVDGCMFKQNSNSTDNTYSDIYVYHHGGGHSDMAITNNWFLSSYAKYNIEFSATTAMYNWVITGNRFSDANSKGLSHHYASQWHVDGNGKAHISPGEVRVTEGTLTGGNVGGTALYWANPCATDVLIRRVVVKVDTVGGTGGSTLQIGIADDYAGTNVGSEFFTAMDANSAAVYDSWNTTDTGAQTKYVLCQESGAAADAVIVGDIQTQKATNLVGTFYVEYMGV